MREESGGPMRQTVVRESWGADVRQQTVVEVFGVERTVGSPINMRLLLLLPEIHTELRDDKPVFEKRCLVWEEDMQMHSKFLDRMDKFKEEHASYMRQHPELHAMMANFLQFLLLQKPSDVFMFIREDFSPFTSRRPPGVTFNTSSP
ncbi:unnamed protein product [Coregonus sp. 'balchen']|nr:unnamed protein product [Coregonus sp. 'balchen']